ncbi:MAG: hypothetical protein SGARI_005187, partial [Bacillariaceae sp.]
MQVQSLYFILSKPIKVFDVFSNVMHDLSTQMMSQVIENESKEDFDVIAAAQQTEETELQVAALTSVVDACGWLIKVHQSSAWPALQSILPTLQLMVQDKMLSTIRAQALCTIIDMIEHCPCTDDHLNQFVHLLLSGVSDRSSEVLQTSAFGLGICAQYAGAVFDHYAAEALARLIALVARS